MRVPSALNVPVQPWGLAMTAILSIQLGSALSVDMIEEIGPAGTGWLRLSMGAAILLLIARPPLRAVRRGDVLPLSGSGS
jgi:inner membrane transporter RhtA